MTQIAVKVSEELLARLDDLVAQGVYPSRSAAVRQGLESVLLSYRLGAIDRGFREGFLRTPETDGEIEDARRLAVEAIDDEPWERWW